MSRRGRIFVLSAPSGAGKSTLIERVVRALPRMWHSVSATTRMPRYYEKEGVHYFFLGSEDFQRMIKGGGLLEWAEVHGDFYGTPAEAVDAHLDAGEDVIMDLDVQGALQVKKRRPEATLIFIMPPSLEVLHARLVSRKTDAPERIEGRLQRAEMEMAQRSLYDHIILNDVLEEASRELMSIIRTGGGASKEELAES